MSLTFVALVWILGLFWTCAGQMCATYSPPTSLENANCTDGVPGYRTITCFDGYSSTPFIPGTLQNISDSTSHLNCTFILDMCLYSPTNATNNPNGACVNNTVNQRTITCSSGYGFDNITMNPTTSKVMVGPSNFTPVCSAINMCAVYSPTAGTAASNLTCLWNISLINRRIISCKVGYFQPEFPGNYTYTIVGTQQANECSELGMCIYDPFPPNATCSNPGVNQRIITCNSGYSGNSSLLGVTRTVIGQSYPGGWTNCSTILSMCLYSLNSTIINGSCFNAGFNTRRIVCNAGYSFNTSILGTNETIIGRTAIAKNCTTQLDMCLYSPNGTISNAVCYSNGVNSRKIVCDPGWSSNNTIPGITQTITGTAGYISCSIMDMCSAYSPIAPQDGTCYFTSTLPNSRVIVCKPGYSTDGTIAGRNHTIIGPLAHPDCVQMDMCLFSGELLVNAGCTNNGVNSRTVTCDPGWGYTPTDFVQPITGAVPNAICDVQLDMCSVYSPTISNGLCTNNLFNHRSITCNDGYATSPSQIGQAQEITGNASYLPCVQLDMCQVYSPTINSGLCSSVTPNTRDISCYSGYSTNASLSGINVRVIGTTTIDCDVIINMCTNYSSTIIQGTCYFDPARPGIRTWVCDPGYSSNSSKSGVNQTVSGGVGGFTDCLTILSMCTEYSPTVTNGTCFDSAINTRTIKCDPGFAIQSNRTDGAIQTVVGPGPIEICSLPGPCLFFSPAVINGVCSDVNSSPPRTITCDDGWSSNGTYAGIVQVLYGSIPHRNCTFELDMCLVSPNLPHASCISNGFNSRTIVCNPGYSFTNSSPPDTQQNFTGTGLAPSCLPTDMCIVYSPVVSYSGTCTWSAINQRIITCPSGYTTRNTSEVLQEIVTGPGGGEDCFDLDECEVGLWASRRSNNTGKPCTEAATCLNQVGTFACCDEGFFTPPNTTECADINECVTGEFATKNSSNTLKPCTGVTNCINFLNGSFGCCSVGFTTIDFQNCIDQNECTLGLATRCTRGDLCVNTEGNYTCCEANQTSINNTCVPCFEDPVPAPTLVHPFPSLQKFANYSNLTFGFKTCSGCSGIRVSVKASRNAGCVGSSTLIEQCRFACTNQTFVVTAANAINVLGTAFSEDGFANDIAWALWGINVSVSEFRKRANDFPLIYPCENASMAPQILAVFQDLATEIVPNAPGLTIIPSPSSCSLSVSSTDPTSFNPIGVIIGVVLGVLAALLLIGYIIYRIQTRSLLHHLPKSVNWSYKLYEKMPYSWTMRGTSDSHYFFKVLERDSDHFKRALDLFNFTSGADKDYGGYRLEVTKITAVYNKILITNFINSYKIMIHRYKTNKNMFFAKPWEQEDDAASRTWRQDRYQELIDKYDWNQTEWGSGVPILPACHGTDVTVANAICEGGFAALSSLDAGWYGKGIYFTSYAWYTFPYIVVKRSPAILLCWILPGHTLPVNEHHKGKSSLIGKAINGYMSHFVVTTRSGETPPKPTTEMFDEFVIPQESQITPAFVFDMNLGSLKRIIKEWNRETPSEYEG